LGEVLFEEEGVWKGGFVKGGEFVRVSRDGLFRVVGALLS
jgi:hypothetical protein